MLHPFFAELMSSLMQMFIRGKIFQGIRIYLFIPFLVKSFNPLFTFFSATTFQLKFQAKIGLR